MWAERQAGAGRSDEVRSARISRVPVRRSTASSSGDVTLDTAALTGEHSPRCLCGRGGVSGCINMGGVLTIRTTGNLGIHGVQDSGSGGECRLTQVTL
ncbi:MAG: hypothetical protein ACLVJ6_16045 [Merdibacter sp.]